MAREMKDSGIEWIGHIPSDWEILPQKYVMHKEKVLCDHYNGEDIISLSMQGVHVRDLDAGGKMPTTFDGYQYVEPEDMLLCLFDIDVTPRCVGVVHDYGLTSPAYSRFKMHTGFLNRYYDYLLRFIDNEKVFVHLAKNLRSSLTETDFGSIKTIAPSSEEQTCIAAFLDHKCAEIDSVIAATQRTIEEYKALKQSIITEAVTKGVRGKRPMKDSGIEWIGKIPEDWEIHKLKRLLWERNVRSETGDEMLLSVSQYYGVIPSSENKNKTMLANSYIGYKKVMIGDLVFNKLNPALARFGDSQYEGITSPDFAVYHPRTYVRAKFLALLLKTSAYGIQLKRYSRGIGDGFMRLYTGDLFEISAAVPTPNEQDEILAYVEEKSIEIDRLIEKKEQFIAELESYKKSVIYEYVTGKKEVPACQ